MNAVERVKSICKERKIPISRLEKDLDFGNAYISGLKKGSLPNDRLLKIADYFGVSVDYLMTGKEPEIEDKYGAEITHLFSKIRNDEPLRNALLKYFDLSDKQKNHVLETINILSEVK